MHRSFLSNRVQLALGWRDHAARVGDTVDVRIAPEHLTPLMEDDTR